MDTVGLFEKRGSCRRYRVAVYGVCGSPGDVDVAFDRLIETMLADRREDYFWGVMLDHAPSPLFRAFGDGAIEERVRMRFEKLCSEYPECGFFCLLRGRRYFGRGVNRYFRCEGGLYGALRMLAGGRGEGFTLRLSTGDTVEHSDRVFIRDIRGGASKGEAAFFPGDITRSSFIGGSVSVCSYDGAVFGERRRFIRGVFSENAGNYRVLGWVSFPISARDKVSVYRIKPALLVKKSVEDIRGGSLMTERIVLCAERGFAEFGDSFGACRCGGTPNESECGKVTADGCAWELISALSLAALGRIDAVNLKERAKYLVGCIDSGLGECVPTEAGFVRVVLLSASAFFDTLGAYGAEFYALSTEAKEMAERLRREYENGSNGRIACFMPCEMVAFRVETSERFCGFTALWRTSDRFLYLLGGDSRAVRRLFLSLISVGFGRCGVMGRNGYCRCSSALLLAVCAEMQNRVFSRIASQIPEIRAGMRVFGALPLDCGAFTED